MKGIVMLRNGQRYTTRRDYDDLKEWIFSPLEMSTYIEAFGPLFEDGHGDKAWLIRRDEIIGLKEAP